MTNGRVTRWRTALTALALLGTIGVFDARCAAIDRVTFRHQGMSREVDGKALIEAADGGLLLLAADGALWPIPSEDLIDHEKDAIPFEPLDAEALSAQLRGELSDRFDTYKTAHYLVCYNTSREYAQWCSGLFERLYRVFTNFWSRKGFELSEPEFPLVAIVFDERQAYEQHASAELKDAVQSVIGYYSLQSNRMTMFDLTGLQALRRPGSRRTISEEINDILSQPQAGQNVATIIHEATHQIAFNCGLQTRYADIPLWVSEGIAVYFETPDLASEKGWRSIGAVNENRLARFADYAATRPTNSLEKLIVDDRRFRDPKSAVDAYAEAWAVNYFLLNHAQRTRQYVSYLKKLSQKTPLVWDNPEARLAEFKAAFGDLEKLDAEMLRYLRKLH